MENVPVILGQYRLGKTLGIGAFGKVKCKLMIFPLPLVPLSYLFYYFSFSSIIFPPFFLFSHFFPSTPVSSSGSAFNYWSKSCYKNFK